MSRDHQDQIGVRLEFTIRQTVLSAYFLRYHWVTESIQSEHRDCDVL